MSQKLLWIRFRIKNWLKRNFKSSSQYQNSIIDTDLPLSKTQLLKLIEKGKSAALETDTIVRFRQIPFGSSLLEVSQVLGEPYTIHTNSDRLKSHQIWVYKMLIGEHKANVFLHFIKSRLFLVKVSFRSFQLKDKEIIRNHIAQKYLGQIQEKPNFAVSDVTGNGLVLKDSGNVTVFYTCSSPWVVSFIEKEIDLQIRKQSVKKTSIQGTL